MIRLLLTLSVPFGKYQKYSDVKVAFLHATLLASLQYWTTSQKITGGSDADGKIFRLRQSFCGLLQAPGLWIKLLGEFLQLLGFTVLETTQFVFPWHSRGGVVYILAYMDIILLFGEKIQFKKLRKAYRKSYNLRIL